MSLFAKIGIIV